MMGAIGRVEILILLLIYILPILFVIWMTYRFVKAHEKMADGIYEIKGHLRKKSRDDPPRR